MEEQTVKLLEQLAQKLGTTVEFLWDILLKQQYIEVVTNFLVAIILSIVVFTCYKKLPPIIKTAETKKDSWYNEMSPRQFRWTLYWTLQVVLVVAIILALFNGIKILCNPEYYALQEILKVL